MRLEASGYMHDERIALYLIPETDVERVLLRAMWKHGSLVVTNGVMDRTGQGFAIKQAKEESSDDATT